MSETTRRTRKRLDLLDSLDAFSGARAESEPAVAPTDRGTTERGQESPAPTRRTSVYLPAATLRRLKELALARDCKVNDLLVEGAETVLRKSGYLPSGIYRDTS